MSNAPEHDLDLEKLFLPAWAQEPSSGKSYARYEGQDFEPDRKRDRHGPRPRQSEAHSRGPRNRPDRERPGRNRTEAPGQKPEERRFSRDRRGPGRQERRPPPAPLPEIEVSLIPEEKGVESLARQIRMTGRAYPLFGIAQMILQKPERHAVVFNIKKNAEGKAVQPLFVCALDDTLWLSEHEAVGHVLKNHFATFYQAERTATEPPKGKYTFVAQCGLSGIILGPPNYHDYQNQLRKLHAERFSRMPFETFKSRVRIVRDEEVVKKWVDEQSWKTEYLCLNMPEALRLGNAEAVEKHFREHHKDNIIKPVESFTLSGMAARALRCGDLVRLVRNVWEDQRRFPLQIATNLSQQFAALGLHFFKVNRTITHVSVARPHYLDLESTPVSEGVKRIVQHINAHPKCTRRQLLGALTPTESASAEGRVASGGKIEPASGGEPAANVPGAPSTQPVEPTPEQTAIIADLHWLIHQGHVIEFADGTLESAKKPIPKPPKPQKTAADKEQPAAPQPNEEAAAQESAPSAQESTIAPEAAVPSETDSARDAQAAESIEPSPPSVEHLSNLSEPELPSVSEPQTEANELPHQESPLNESTPPAPGESSVENVIAPVESPS